MEKVKYLTFILLYSMKEKISITLEKKIVEEVECLVDGLRIRNTSQAIEYLLRRALGDEKTAVILCGGPEKYFLVGREYRFTALLGSASVAEEIVRRLKRFGFRKIFVVAREDILTEMFRLMSNGERLGVEMEYVKETHSNGSMDSLRMLRGKILGNFLVVFGDVVFETNLNRLWDSHIKNQGTATLLLESYPKPSEKGVVDLEGDLIKRFVQKPKKLGSNIAFSSIFAAGPELLESQGASLEEDVFPRLAEQGLLFGHVTSGWIKHAHTKEDLKELEGLVRKNA